MIDLIEKYIMGLYPHITTGDLKLCTKAYLYWIGTTALAIIIGLAVMFLFSIAFNIRINAIEKRNRKSIDYRRKNNYRKQLN